MFNRLVLTFGLMFLVPGCGTSTPVDQPYDSCVQGDACSLQGFACSSSTLPAAASYTGNFCTAGCTAPADCYQGLGEAICVLYSANAGQCYLTCPAGNNCPYGQQCFSFQDSFSGGLVNLCTP
jgi:hypothetical protein